MESCYRYRWRRVRWRRWVGLPAAVGGVCDDCVPARQPRSTARCSACTAAARGPSGMVVNCTVLSCPVECTVLYCTVLRARRHPAAHRIWPSAVLYCTVLYCTVLCCTACTAASRGPSDMAVSCTVLYCTVHYCTACTAASRGPSGMAVRCAVWSSRRSGHSVSSGHSARRLH